MMTGSVFLIEEKELSYLKEELELKQFFMIFDLLPQYDRTKCLPP
jgi:hypothetical protein